MEIELEQGIAAGSGGSGSLSVGDGNDGGDDGEWVGSL